VDRGDARAGVLRLCRQLYLIDVKFGVIMDVEASRAIRQAEVGAARTMIERTEDRFGLKPHLPPRNAAFLGRPISSSGAHSFSAA
jgi:hypothetical protein